jgi:hypothetical protein
MHRWASGVDADGVKQLFIPNSRHGLPGARATLGIENEWQNRDKTYALQTKK